MAAKRNLTNQSDLLGPSLFQTRLGGADDGPT